MKAMTKRVKASAAAAFVLFMWFLTSMFGTSAVAFAAETDFDRTDVMDDLQGSSIDGKPFNLKEYAFNSLLSTTVLYLAEYCYSFDTARQGNYNLYLYVWNPQGLEFVDSGLNQIEFTYGDANAAEYVKKPLKLLSVSSRTNYERLFYKFKIQLTDSEKTLILRKLNSSERVYHVVGIEIMERGRFEPRDFGVNKIYTYSGYAKGYGANREEDTLRYSSTFGDVLDIERQGGLHQTFFRPAVNNEIDGTTQETLQSVYFSVPNKYFENDFRLGAVRMEWLKTQTAWGLVTGNQTVYDALLPWVGQSVGGLYANGDRTRYYTNERGGRLPTPYAFSSKLGSYNRGATGGIPYLAYLFPSDEWSTDSADDYILPWEDMLDYMRSYHDRYDTEDKTYYDADYEWAHVLGQEARYGCNVDYTRPYGGEYLTAGGVTYPYSRALFMSAMDEKTVMDIASDKEYSLTSRKVDGSWWTKLWNNGEAMTKYTTRYDGIEAIHPVTKDDFKSTDSATCETLFLDQNDYAEFKSFYDRARLLGETVVLVRYDVGNYLAAEATEGLPKNSGLVTGYDEGDTNARMFSMSAYLGLDVIHLEFDNGEEQFFLPCVSTPIDAGSDGTAASGTHSDRNALQKAVKIILIVLIVLLAVVLVLGAMKLIGVGIEGINRNRHKRE